MKKQLLVLAVIIVTYYASFGQGTIRGKITDENGEALIAVTVMLKANHTIINNTDLDGNYALKLPDSSAQILVISYIGYKTIEHAVQLVKGKVVIKNFSLVPAAQEIDVVEIVAKAVKTNDSYMEKVKMKSATTLDYVSSEAMKKIGDPNVTAAVARVSGVSTNGDLITVRGIGDRYVKTTINGCRIPTLDPFTNNIKLDMFPASLVDNIIITKTASPDLPGDWAGAYISVETKDYPDKLSVNVETSVGYNSQSSLKEVLTSQRSTTDWLGYDNGFRDYNHADYTPVNINPTPYQEFVALGYGDYFKSIGVTGENWKSNLSFSDTYYKLGLVQLKLLDIGQFNDKTAFTAASDKFLNGPYKAQAFNILNAEGAKAGQSFANDWNTLMRKAPLNFSQSFSIGNQTLLFGRPLGLLGGFRYVSAIQYDPNSIKSAESDAASDVQVSKETNGWSALLNLAYKFNPNNSVSLLFMPNLTGVNKIRNTVDPPEDGHIAHTISQFYEQRKQMVYQLKSEHYLPNTSLKIELNASYTDGKSTAPDFKNLQYWQTPTGYQIGGNLGDGIHRYYRYLSDDLFDSRLAAELPLGNKPGLTRKLKFGGAYQYNSKKNDQYDYGVLMGPHIGGFNGDVDQFFNLNNFGISKDLVSGNQTINMFYTENGSPANHTIGNSKVTAEFIMLDYAIIPSLRFSGGLRVEQATIFTDVFKYDSLGLAPDDERRKYAGDIIKTSPGKLSELNYLPSANIIYTLNHDELAPVNLRLNYSKTVARPSIRELSETAVYDYELRSTVFGNPNLKTVQINNYDLRLESYFKSGENVSLSLFYKDFKNHIELIQSTQGYSWQNVEKSHVTGIEIEGRKTITKHLDIRANVTFVNSLTKVVRSNIQINNSTGAINYIPTDTVTRSMYGQAPYIINCILAYTFDRAGLNAAISYNIQGPRLVIASSNNLPYDIYELPRNLLDFKLTKSLGTHFTTSATVRNVLNSPVRRSAKGWAYDFDKYTYGTIYELGISYKL